MVAVENKKRIVEEKIALDKGTDVKNGFYKTYKRSKPILKVKSRNTVSSASVLLLIGILLITTVLSFDNPIFFRKLLACNFIVFFAVIANYAGLHQR